MRHRQVSIDFHSSFRSDSFSSTGVYTLLCIFLLYFWCCFHDLMIWLFLQVHLSCIFFVSFSDKQTISSLYSNSLYVVFLLDCFFSSSSSSGRIQKESIWNKVFVYKWKSRKLFLVNGSKDFSCYRSQDWFFFREIMIKIAYIFFGLLLVFHSIRCKMQSFLSENISLNSIVYRSPFSMQRMWGKEKRNRSIRWDSRTSQMQVCHLIQSFWVKRNVRNIY